MSKELQEKFESRILHLYEVEGLSQRQIASTLKICRRRLGKIIKGGGGR